VRSDNWSLSLLKVDAKLNAAKAIVAERLAEVLAKHALGKKVHPDWYNELDRQTVAAIAAWRELQEA
jgi:hypothetical protein